MAVSTEVVKRCVSCHKDVTQQQRMKDSSGRYWCITCGTEDQKKKSASGIVPAKHKKSMSGGMSAEKIRLVKMLGFLGLLAAAAAVRFAVL